MKQAFLAAVCLLLCSSTWLWAEAIPNDECLTCHEDKDLTKKDAAGKTVSLFVDKQKLAGSVHAKSLCVGCHADVTESPHPDNFAAKPPTCVPCHKPQSETYGASVHGRAVAEGKSAAAGCTDCHGGHDVQKPRMPSSPLCATNLAATCGRCHQKATQDYLRSTHAKALLKGIREAPTCTDCHREHKIERLHGTAPITIAGHVCGHCHATEHIAEKYNIPSARVETFFESYHGLAARLGSKTTANCASCHGWHDVLPSTDPASTIYPSNLPKTCGSCHPAIGTKLATEKIKIHTPPGAAQGKPWIVNVVAWVYIVLIVFTIGGMFFHNLLDYVVKVRSRIREVKANPGERVFSAWTQTQHLTLIVLFVLLVYTGFVHKFPDAFWSWPFRALPDGNYWRSFIHRLAGWLFVGLMIVHALGLIGTRGGRGQLRELFPRWKDVKDLAAKIAYDLGWRSQPPEYAHFNYVEKSEYWALMWGSVVMIITGIMLIFTELVLSLFPKVVLDLAQVIHYYEAVLATLAIIVWHFYAVIYDPAQYPMNPAWLTRTRPRSAVPHVGAEPQPAPSGTDANGVLQPSYDRQSSTSSPV